MRDKLSVDLIHYDTRFFRSLHSHTKTIENTNGYVKKESSKNVHDVQIHVTPHCIGFRREIHVADQIKYLQLVHQPKTKRI